MIRKISLFCLLSMLALPAASSDSKREQDYAASLQQSPLIGKIVWLEADGKRFLGLYTETEKTDNKNAVIILHDIGAYPDQKPVEHFLRVSLPQHQWATLALQMPLREPASSQADYYPLFNEAKGRIVSAIDYLQKNGATRIVLAGYGLGALMASFTVNETPNNIQALITISIPAPETTEPQVQTQAFFKNIALPLLDVYAEFDLPAVLDTARQRRLSAKDNPVYRQVRIDGETHAFQQDHERLIKLLYSWLDTTFQQN